MTGSYIVLSFMTTLVMLIMFATLVYLYLDSLKLSKTTNNLQYYANRPSMPYNPSENVLYRLNMPSKALFESLKRS